MGKVPLHELLANANMLADTLSADRRPQAAMIVRELAVRLEAVPVAAPPVEPAPRLNPDLPRIAAPAWCDQCERMVKQGCKSKFCKVAA